MEEENRPENVSCDGRNPETQEPCVLGHHKGYHKAADGTQWLDED